MIHDYQPYNESNMEASKPKCVYSNYTLYRVNKLRLGCLIYY